MGYTDMDTPDGGQEAARLLSTRERQEDLLGHSPVPRPPQLGNWAQGYRRLPSAGSDGSPAGSG